MSSGQLPPTERVPGALSDRPDAVSPYLAPVDQPSLAGTAGEEIQGGGYLRATLAGLLRDPRALIGLALIGTIVLLCALAPLIARYNPNLPDINALNQPPSAAHWFGTDNLGRDLWSRILWGGRVSLPAGLEIVFLSLAIGVPMGMLAGFGGRVIDDGIMRCVDLLLAVPGLLLAIAIVSLLGPGLKAVIIGLGIAGIPAYARIARASTLQLRAMDYVDASRALGAGTARLLFRHVLPNILDPLVILATLSLSVAILAAAALSFLGIGTQLPDADWGTMLSEGYDQMFLSAGEVIFPAAAIVLSVLGINLIGDSLGDALNPKSRAR